MIASLPDIGNVAGIGMDLLVKKLNAKVFAELYAYWPPAVSYDGGKIKFDQSSYKFYSVKQKNLIIFSGDFNPTDPKRLYEICYEVVEMAKKLNVKTLFSIGGAMREPLTEEPKIFFAATSENLIEKIKKEKISQLDNKGRITGFNGLVLGIAQEKKLEGACILGEIDNPNVIQPKAAGKIINALTNLLNIEPLDLSELKEQEKKKKFMEEQANYMEEMAKRDNQPGIA